MVSSNASSFDLAGGADTIVAPATPPGSGALAVVRVSGPGVASVVRSVCPGLDLGRPRQAQLVSLRGAHGERVERAIVIPYSGPSSYTGEDMLEVMVHGSPALVRSVMGLFVDGGCRIAERGEFTRRALANGKIDLVQAEGIAELIRAETELEVTTARGLVEGRLSARVRDLRRHVIDLMARMEGALDFAGQGVEADLGELEARRMGVVEELEELLSTVRTGQRVRDGLRVVIVGPPNAGKSTLFNRLLRTERAIVTPEPGTTRDFIEGEVEIGGLRVILVDTAGLGRGGEAAEREGVRRSLEMARNADMVIQVCPVDETCRGLVAAPLGVPVLQVRTKIDLIEDAGFKGTGGSLAISAVTGEGWERFENRLEELLLEDVGPVEGRVVVNERQGAALARALGAARRAPLGELELAVEDLRVAAGELAELLGEVHSEEVLDAVFSTFCLGK